MRVNRSKLSPNLLDDEVLLPQCPKEFRKEAERLVRMLLREALHRDYRTMTELDRLLCTAYWMEYDRLAMVGKDGWFNFEMWFREEATWPELIRRARQWLVGENILIVKAEVEENARAASEHWKQHIKVPSPKHT